MKNENIKRYHHFQLNVNGINFVYTYIRKNGCTAFKNLFISQSPMKDKVKECRNILDFMIKYHKIRDAKDINSVPNKIAIIRDPRDRVISAYTNRIIQDFERGSDILESVSQNLSIPLESLTFRTFVNQYLTISDTSKIDCHLWSQKEHLAAIDYNHLWLLNNLYDNATDFFGKNIADSFFLNKVNATSGKQKYDEDSADVPLHELYDRYVKDKKLPSKSALLDNELNQIVEATYAEDLQLYYKLKSMSKIPS